MSIATNTPAPGYITLIDDYDTVRTTVISTAGKTGEEVAAEIDAFFALSVPPATTRADVIAQMAVVLGFTGAEMISFFDGSMN